MWLKARTNSSSSSDIWHYFSVPDSYSKKSKRDSLVDTLEYRLNANVMHHTYHGVEWKRVKIENVPREVLDKQIESAQSDLKHARVAVKFLKEEAQKCKKTEIKKKCDVCKGKRTTMARGLSGKLDRVVDCVYCRGKGKRKYYSIY